MLRVEYKLGNDDRTVQGQFGARTLPKLLEQLGNILTFEAYDGFDYISVEVKRVNEPRLA